MNTKIKIFLVDDEAVFLKLLEIQFIQSGNVEIETYATGELCIESLSHKPDVIILDYQLDGVNKHAMNGLQTLDKITAFDAHIPVIMLSAQDKIDVAIECMHHKAVDYVVKSETAFFRLQKIISTVFEARKREKELNWYMDHM